LRAAIEELKAKKFDLVTMKEKDFKLGKIKEFIDFVKTRKAGVFSFKVAFLFFREIMI
jgi:hypothetical protein